MIIPFGDKKPTIANTAFIAPDSWVIGDVCIGNKSSIFFGAVLRGDILSITIGDETNIQEHTVVHTSEGRSPTFIGNQVTVGHRATVHGCRVEDRALIGMGAVVLDGAVVGEESIIAAGAVVLEETKIPPRSLAVGIPAKVVKTLSDEDARKLHSSAMRYVNRAEQYLELLTRLP